MDTSELEKAAQAKQARTHGKKAEVERTQIQTFTAWANNVLKPRKMKIRNLAKDLKNGEILINLVCELLHLKTPKYTKNTKKPLLMASNIELALGLLQKNGVNIGSIQPMEVLEGKITAILGLFWVTISAVEILGISSLKKFKIGKPQDGERMLEISEDQKGLQSLTGESVKSPESVNELATEVSIKEDQLKTIKEEDPQKILLNWVNKLTCKNSENQVKNFKKDWMDGTLLTNLLENFQNSKHYLKTDIEDPLDKNKHAIEIAYKIYGIPKLISPEAITNGYDAHSLMTYINMIKREYEGGFQSAKNLEIEREELAQKEELIIMQCLGDVIKAQKAFLHLSTDKEINAILTSQKCGSPEELGISYSLLAQLLEKEHGVKLDIIKDNEEHNKLIVTKYLEGLGFTINSDKELYNAILLSNLKTEETLLKWANSELQYDIPIESISELISTSTVFADLLSCVDTDRTGEYIIEEKDFELEEDKLLSKIIKILNNKYGITIVTKAKQLQSSESPLLATAILTKIYEQTEQKKILSNFDKYLEWAVENLKEEFPNKENIKQYGKEWSSGIVLLELMSKLDSEKDYSNIKKIENGKLKWEAIKEILLSRFGIREAIKLDPDTLSQSDTFNESVLSIISNLKQVSETGITDSNYSKDIQTSKISTAENLKTLNNFFGTSIKKTSELKSAEFLKAFLDKTNTVYEEELVSEFISDEERLNNFIKILKDKYSESSHTIESVQFTRNSKELDSLAANIKSSSEESNKKALLKLLKSARLQNVLSTPIVRNSNYPETLKTEDKDIIEFADINIKEILSEHTGEDLTKDFVLPTNIVSLIKKNFPDNEIVKNYKKENSMEGDLNFISNFSDSVQIQSVIKNDLFSGEPEKLSLFIIDLCERITEDKRKEIVFIWLSSILSNSHSDLFAQHPDLDQLCQSITDTENIQFIKDLTNHIDPTSIPESCSIASVLTEIKESYRLSAPPDSLSSILTELYIRSLNDFPVRRRMRALKKRQEQDQKQTSSVLDLLASLASTEAEPELNRAGYNVQFTITAAAKRERDVETGGHIKAQVKGPFPINLSKRFKKTKLETVKIEHITKVSAVDYRCNYIPPHQGIYQIRIFIYKKETKVSPIYFAITSKCGFWLKVGADGKIVATDHDVLKQSDFAKQKKAGMSNLKDWRKDQAEKELTFKREQVKELIEKELEKVKQWENASKKLEELKLKRNVNKSEIEENEEKTEKDFKEKFIKNFSMIIRQGLFVKIIGTGIFGGGVKETWLGMAVEENPYLFELDKNFEEAGKLLRMKKGKCKAESFFDKKWMKKFADVNWTHVVKVGEKKGMVIEFENEEVSDYFRRGVNMVMES